MPKIDSARSFARVNISIHQIRIFAKSKLVLCKMIKLRGPVKNPHEE